MKDFTIENVLAALGEYTETGSGQYSACCPAHDDRQASLSISIGDNGKPLLYCFRGCEFADIKKALGFSSAAQNSPRGKNVTAVTKPKPKKRHASMQAAIDSVARTVKEPIAETVLHLYENGKPVGGAIRFNLEGGGKTFRQIHADGKAWLSGAGDDLWPIYKLNDLPAEGPIFLHEGEKACLAGWKIGLPSTCCKGGSNAPQKTDWSTLAGREVVILPDNDPPGEKFAATMVGILQKIKCTVKIICLEGRPEKGDLHDVADQYTADDIRKLAAQITTETSTAIVPVGAPPALPTHATDLNNASTINEIGFGARIVHEAAGKLLYSHDRGIWHYFDGKRWVDDKKAIHPKRIATETAHKFWQEMANVPHDAAHAKLAQAFALKAHDRRCIENAVALAANNPAVEIRSNQFDADPWLLNCENGVIDVRKMMNMTPHDPKQLHTKLANVVFDPMAWCPKWVEFVDTITCGDKELAAFLQRTFGLALSADQSEQAVWFHHGAGGNGKGTFLSIMDELLGDYAAPASVETFIHKRVESDRARAVAGIVGRRLVYAQETDDGSRLSEQAIKSFTGSDPITFRRLYEEEVTTYPTWHIHLAVNEKPQIRGQDIGIWRRVKLVPWNHRFTGHGNRNRAEVHEELIAERSGILNWLLHGLDQWLYHGLQEPECVLAATREYQNESDLVGAFIADECTIEPDAVVLATDLLSAFRDWCKRTGCRAFSRQKFGDEMESRGYWKEKATGGEYRRKTIRHGIALN